MQIQDLLDLKIDSIDTPSPLQSDENPYLIDDILLESELLDIRIDTRRRLTGILFEMRTALQYRGAEAALYIARNTTSVEWNADTLRRPEYSIAFPIEQSQVRKTTEGVLLNLQTMFNVGLTVCSQSSSFYLLNVPTLPLSPPDYSEGPQEIIENSLPRWETVCQIVRFAHSCEITAN